MKANIMSSLQFELTDNFKKEVQKRIPDGIKEVWLYHFEMVWIGHGHYKYELLVIIDEAKQIFTWETNASDMYDFWKGAERTRKVIDFEKNRVLSLLEQYQDELYELRNSKL